MGQPVYLYRKLHAKDRAVLSEYTHLAGLVIWASNALHAKFLRIFEEIMAFDCASNLLIKRRMARSMWHSLRSDDIQRSVLKAAVLESMRDDHQLTKSLIWALNSAGKLAEYRNDAVHTAFEFNNANSRWTIIPNQYAGAPHRVEKLNRVGYAKLFRLLLGDLIQLRVYIDYVRAKVGGDSELSLPRRPVLKSSLLVQRTPPRSNNRQAPGAKFPPRQPGFPPTMAELRQIFGDAEARKLAKLLK